MSAADLAPDADHPVASLLVALHEALDSLPDSIHAPADHATLVRDCERAVSRLEAVKLALVASAERARVPASSGHSGTSSWLAATTRKGGATAAGEARLAVALDDAPATGDALGHGDISPEHATVITRSLDRLPEGLSTDQRAEVERHLVDQATRLTPERLRRAARRAIEAVEPDPEVVDAVEDEQVAAEEASAYDRASLTLHDNGDGTTTGRFTVPTFAAQILRRILDAMTSPRRAHLGAPEAQAGPTGVRRDPAAAAGQAFAEVLEHLPIDRLHEATAATLVVTLDLDTLRERLRVAGLDTGDLVSAAHARRLACSAGLVPAVLGAASLPLDLGRRRRLFTAAQRLALATRHTACAAQGCERPFAWCELHHRTPWSRGGRTDLAEAVPLCGFHHRRIHDSGYLHARLPDGSIRFARRT